MEVLILLSLPFGLVGYIRRSWWVIGLPYVAWVGLAVLASAGLLPGTSSVGPPEAVLLAGTVGAVIAAIGVLLGRTRPPRTLTWPLNGGSWMPTASPTRRDRRIATTEPARSRPAH